jgi:hypothetical protein
LAISTPPTAPNIFLTSPYDLSVTESDWWLYKHIEWEKKRMNEQMSEWKKEWGGGWKKELVIGKQVC